MVHEVDVWPQLKRLAHRKGDGKVFLFFVAFKNLMCLVDGNRVPIQGPTIRINSSVLLHVGLASSVILDQENDGKPLTYEKPHRMQHILILL